MLTEHQEQVKLIRWTKREALWAPELDRIFAIPNGGHRFESVGAKMKREGTKKGVPDLMLPVVTVTHPGLFIEMKRIKGGSSSPYQKDWAHFLASQGYCCVVTKGFEHAQSVMAEYLGLNKVHTLKEFLEAKKKQ